MLFTKSQENYTEIVQKKTCLIIYKERKHPQTWLKFTQILRYNILIRMNLGNIIRNEEMW